MAYPYAFSISLTPPGAPSLDEQALWIPSPDAEAAAGLQQRRARIAQACTDAVPTLAPRYIGLQEFAEIVQEDDEPGPDSAAQALARYQRYLELSCARAYGHIGLQLFDTGAMVEFELDDLRQWQHMRPLVQQELAALLSAFAEADGLRPVPVPGPFLSANPAAQADAVLEQQTLAIAGHARKARSMGRQAALGWPSVVLVGVLATGAALWLVLNGYLLGSLARVTDPDRPLQFINQRLEEGRADWGPFARFELHGHVKTDDPTPAVVPATVRVSRAVALRTGNGARYTVLPTRDTAQPYVLRSEHDETGPVLAWGERGLHWSAALALLPPVLWYAAMLRPWRAAVRADGTGRIYARRAMVKAWGSMLLWGAALFGIFGARSWFG